MNKLTMLLTAVTAVALTGCSSDAKDTSVCAPLGLSKGALFELRENSFILESDTDTDQFALELVECLGNPDPDLRDKIAFEGLSLLMRQEQISTDAVKQIGTTLVEKLTDPDPNGFTQPFAALVLSEVARVDRVSPFLRPDERADLVTAAINYVSSVTDYRGFSETEGWRHGVAHGADFLMQLALNEAVTRGQLLQIRDAVATQIIPQNNHFYIYGESERLARPILFIANRNVLTEEEWTGWFNTLTLPAPFASWDDVFFSQEGLARRHNIRAFALAIYVNADAGGSPELQALIPGALAILRATG